MKLRSLHIPSELKLYRTLDEFSGNISVFSEGVKRAVVFSGKVSYSLLGKEVERSLTARHVKVLRLEVSENSIASAESLISSVKGADVVFGVGGGKVIDVAKYVAFRADLPFVSVPTVASQDGICSPVAVLRGDTGISTSLGCRVPTAVITCLDVIRLASQRSVLSGVGDLLSNISAVEDWQLSAHETGESFDEFSALTASSAARALLAESALLPEGLTSDRFLSQLVNGLVLSGIAMTMAGTSRPCSGAEHKISHALDELYKSPGTHGEQVAIGMIYSTYLREADWKHLIRLWSGLGLPVVPGQLGLNEEQMVQAIVHAPTTRANRFTILEKVVPTLSELWEMLEEISCYYSEIHPTLPPSHVTPSGAHGA